MKTTKAARAELLKMGVNTFATAVGLKLGKRVQNFIERHQIDNVSALLDTSVIHEKNATWKSLAGLRAKLLENGFDNNEHEYKFLLVPI